MLTPLASWFDRYSSLTSMAVQRWLTFRAGFFWSLAALMVQAFVLYFIWRAVFMTTDQVGGFHRGEMIAYLFVSQAVANLQGWFGSAENQISTSIRSGRIATELLRPLDFQWARFFESLGSGAVQGAMVLGLMAATSLVIPEIRTAGSWANVPLFLLSVALGFASMFSVGYIAGLASFWTLNFWGLFTAKKAFVDFFSGAVVPLTLFPSWLQAISQWLPFRSLVFVPTSIFLGKIGSDQIVRELLLQLFWAVFLWIVGRLLWRWAARQITIHGS